jgi:precorrin-2 dehydrogenase/sirohydrochlorin ferrochelatase
MNAKHERTPRDETRSRPVLPVSLLVAGRPCLVVGGGRVAARKVDHLLEAGAAVTVVSPRLGAALRKRLREGRIRHLARGFEDADLKGRRLVFAVTNDTDVNRRVIERCRRRRILCSAADENWPQGDFVTPAVVRRPDLVVTVSTGGRSCRQARAVKERIAQALDDMQEPPGAAHAS